MKMNGITASLKTLCVILVIVTITAGSIALSGCDNYAIDKSAVQKIDCPDGWSIVYSSTLPCSKATMYTINFPAFFTPGLIQNTHNFRGYIKLIKKIYIPENMKSRFYLLSLGKIGDADKTYCNGKLIGSLGQFPPHEFSAWNTSRYYVIDSTIITPGKFNTIEVIVGCYAYNRIIGAMYIKPITIEIYNKLLFTEQLKQLFPLFCNIGIGITFFILFLMMCYTRADRNKYITFLLQLIPGLFVVAEPTLPYPIYPDTIIRVKIFATAWSFLVLFHLLFLHRLYQYKRIKIEYILWTFTLLITIAIWHVNTLNAITTTATGAIVILTSLALYNLSLHVEQLLKKNLIAYLFVPIGIVLALTATHDGFVYLSIFRFTIYNYCGYQFDSPIFQYTSNAIFIGAGLIIVYQYIIMSKKIETMNVILEEKVQERTNQLQTSLNNLSKAIEFGFFVYPLKKSHYVSPLVEPKIKKAIVYINNNYRDSISREGLASLCNLHPDYFSKAFKYFTGKSVNDYIYELRVKEAIKLLLERKMNILDIALYIGFDSVKTFNRAFKKFTGKNPSDYRK